MVVEAVVAVDAEKKIEVEEKRVIDDVSGWLRVYSDGSVDRTWTGPPELQFLATPFFPSPSSAAADDGVSLHDLTIDPSTNLSVRIYLPTIAQQEGGDEEKSERQRRLPILLHFHGGGFCISRPSWYMYYQFYSRLARSARAAVVSVYTRSAPEHRLPAAVDDCFAALLWLRSLSRSPDSAADADDHEPLALLRRSADFARVFLIGDSSGGNLVHEVAARAGEAEKREEGGFWSPLRVAGGVLIHPGFVRSERSPSELERRFETPFLTLDMVDKMLALALPVGSTKDHPITCPMGPAAPPLEGLWMPPLLVAVAERDLMKDTELEYCEAIRRAGKEVEVLISPRVGHVFYFDKIAVDSDPETKEQTDALVDAVVGFVDRH